MIAAEPTMATGSGACPLRIAGMMNSSRKAKLTPRPINAVIPRHRPNAITAIMHRATISSRSCPRS